MSVMGDNRDELLYRVAQLYYGADETMESIAATIGVSRSTISRLLTEARESGIVRISLARTGSASTGLALRLNELFGVTARVVDMPRGQSDQQRMDAVARVAARCLGDWVAPGMTLGVAWGTTIFQVATHLNPQPVAGLRVVQLNGAANSWTTGIPYASAIVARIADALDAECTFFSVPAFFDFAETRAAMWRERSVRNVLAQQRTCTLALFGVGGLTGGTASHVYNAGYLDAADLSALSTQGVVGDVCTVLIREDGSYADIAMNARATGPTPQELRAIPRRVCVVAGDTKVPAIVGALRAGVATDLIIDSSTATAVLTRIEAAGRTRET